MNSELTSELIGRPEPRSLLRQDGECLVWTGSLTREGYASISTGRVRVPLHRLVFELTQRKLKRGEVVRHAITCVSRACLAPAHLSAGTQADNMGDIRARRAAGLPSLTTHREREFKARRRAAVDHGF